jgi:ectoine hydroxylase-related dioxygenase (phytanoyl-CoA dioxygenase family)
MTHNEEIFEKNGVILLKDLFPESIFKKIRAEYDQLDSTLDRTNIAKDKPIIVFWKHVVGEQKRIAHFNEFPTLWELISDFIVPALRLNLPAKTKRLQLLETIIFNKPPVISNTLNWHQDVAYFPLNPNNQLAVWLPFEPVTADKSAMLYALGTHKLGIRGSTNLHTKEPFPGEDRELIPDNPAANGYEVVTMEMTNRDMLIHDGYTWHSSGPNLVEGYIRKGLSVRFITDESVFDPRPGQGAAFTKQIDIKPGQVVSGAPFPLL